MGHRMAVVAVLALLGCAGESTDETVEVEPVAVAQSGDSSDCADSPHACPLYGRCTWDDDLCVPGSCGGYVGGEGWCHVVPELWWPPPYPPTPPYGGAWVPLDYCCR